MQISEPEFLRQPRSGPATVPRPAATVILLRGGSERLEVLLVRRNPQARFMPDVWVFPGGSVNPTDGAGLDGLRAAAARELREETAVVLAPGDELVAYARWITPAEVARRFDTWFFLALAPAGASPVVDGAEIVEHRWYAPADALAANAAGELALVFPTIKQLQTLAKGPLRSAEDLLAAARGQAVEPIEPRVLVTDGKPRIVLPGEDGYALTKIHKPGVKMQEHVLPKEGSDPVDSAALHWAEKHPEDDIDHPPPVAPPEPDGIVPNHHSASAEAAALHWHEKHPDDEGEWDEPE